MRNESLDEWRRNLVVSNDNQIEFDSYSISESAVSFAKELAALCDKHGLSAFKGGFRVREGHRHSQSELTRDLAVEYSAMDGRGRPRRKLAVSSNATVRLAIDNEPDTTN